MDPGNFVSWGCLGYKGWDPAQLYGDYKNHEIRISMEKWTMLPEMLTNQHIYRMIRFSASAGIKKSTSGGGILKKNTFVGSRLLRLHTSRNTSSIYLYTYRSLDGKKMSCYHINKTIKGDHHESNMKELHIPDETSGLNYWKVHSTA